MALSMNLLIHEEPCTHILRHAFHDETCDDFRVPNDHPDNETIVNWP